MRFVGLFSLVFALIYIPLWCMRTGLLTRFWAMLGLALGVSLLLSPSGSSAWCSGSRPWD